MLPREAGRISSHGPADCIVLIVARPSLARNRGFRRQLSAGRLLVLPDGSPRTWGISGSLCTRREIYTGYVHHALWRMYRTSQVLCRRLGRLMRGREIDNAGARRGLTPDAEGADRSLHKSTRGMSDMVDRSQRPCQIRRMLIDHSAVMSSETPLMHPLTCCVSMQSMVT